MISTSPAFPRMLGLPPEQVRGRLFRTFVHPEDVAQAVAFLCTPTAAMIRGQTLVVDGGFSLLA